MESPVRLDAEYCSLLEQIQANSFALIDLQLYLDAHPTDEEATTRFKQLAQREHLLKRSFEERFGPLNHYGESRKTSPQTWVDAPWPWEI